MSENQEEEEKNGETASRNSTSVKKVMKRKINFDELPKMAVDIIHLAWPPTFKAKRYNNFE